MIIELLYFDGCPSWRAGLENLKAALDAERLNADVQLIGVNDEADAERHRFLGSPSFRVNGEELWPEVRSQFALGCRIYATPHGLRGVPTVEMLRQKLRTAPQAAGIHQA
jgi:hypothetical protein